MGAARDDQPPPLKRDPRYGYFPWWPEDGDAWVHPEDAAAARRTIPSHRIWRRDGEEGGFVVLTCGETRLRVRPRLWQETPRPAFEVGELVEVLPRGMVNDPHTGRVREVFWDDHAGQIRYRIEVADRAVETVYSGDDLKHVDPARPEPMTRIEPSAEGSQVDQLVDGLPRAERPGGDG